MNISPNTNSITFSFGLSTLTVKITFDKDTLYGGAILRYLIGANEPEIRYSGKMSSVCYNTIDIIRNDVEKRMGGPLKQDGSLNFIQIQKFWDKEIFRARFGREVDLFGISMEDAISIVREHFVEKVIAA